MTVHTNTENKKLHTDQIRLYIQIQKIRNYILTRVLTVHTNTENKKLHTDQSFDCTYNTENKKLHTDQIRLYIQIQKIRNYILIRVLTVHTNTENKKLHTDQSFDCTYKYRK